jgi:hypothetical protein
MSRSRKAPRPSAEQRACAPSVSVTFSAYFKRQRPRAGIQDAERLSSLHAKRVVAIRATWLTNIRRQDRPEGTSVSYFFSRG